MGHRLYAFRLAVQRPVYLTPLVARLRSLVRRPRDLTAQDVDDLTRWWSNGEGWAAGSDYLIELAERCRTADGPILECGSGLTTLIAGVYAPRRSVSLEQDPKWRRRVVRVARLAGVPVDVRDTPLVDYGDFDWFAVPEVLPECFSLVVCDGPPGPTRGGRVGLVPVMGDRIAGATVMLDDTDRERERELMGIWGVSVVGERGRYSVLRVQGPQDHG